MADTPATPTADPAAPVATPPATGADPAPAPSDASANAKTLLTQGDAPTADPAAKALDAKPADKPADAPVLPEKYTLPVLEGQTEIEGFADALTPVFKELGLTQAQVNKLGEAYNKFGETFGKTNEAKEKADFDSFMSDTAKKHTDSIRKDWGADFDANLKVAQRGIARFASAEMKALLDETGLGNHPEFLKAFLTIGKMIQEDKPPTDQTPSGRKSNEDVFYGGSSAAA